MRGKGEQSGEEKGLTCSPAFNNPLVSKESKCIFVVLFGPAKRDLNWGLLGLLGRSMWSWGC